MNKPNLSDIFRNAASHRGEPAADRDVDQLIAEIPRSPLQRELIRFARDLEPESAALSVKLESVLNGDSAVHRRRFAAPRSAHGRRNWRIASALAATVIAAVAVWSAGTLNRSHHQVPSAMTTANDRIFSAMSDDSVAQKSEGGHDEIFNGSFHADEIFSSSRNNNG